MSPDDPLELTVTPSGTGSVIEIGSVIENGAPRRSRTTAIATAVVVAFALGVAVGFGIPHHTAAGPAVASARSTPPPVRGSVTWGTATCSSTGGTRLDIGMQITNHSTEPVVLTGVAVTLPAEHDLVLRGTAWTQCTNSLTSAGTLPLPAGASAWVSATTDMLDPCPVMPVTFLVMYVQDGQAMALPLDASGDQDAGLPCPTR